MSMNGKSQLIWAGVFLGLGLGGFFDGIVLHQILQWHHMVTEDYPITSIDNLQLNVLLDGLFHAATYIFTALGVYMLWRARHTPFSGRVLIGAKLLGWGIFNVVEGLIDHQILGIHHVKPGPNELLWDIGFLIWGAAMLVGGWWLIRSETQKNEASGSVRKMTTS